METIRKRFEDSLRQRIDGKNINTVIPSAAKRDQMILDLARIQAEGPRDNSDYNLKRRFEILRIADTDRLIRAKHEGDDFKFIASLEEMFDILSQAHKNVGHGGEKKTFNEAKKKWANVTQESCRLYISFCEDCHQKKSRKVPKGVVVKPIRSHSMFSRCQVDLINFQTLADGDFKYIMTYVNHFTKFCVLRPLKSKRAEEVAFQLLDIFLTFGAPCILQSDNGREFVNSVLSELSILWPNLKLVTGRPRHPQSQGAVERLNGVIQDKLAIWMKENQSKQWSVGLKFVQWQINIGVHETTGESPFKVTFGMEPSVGLASTILPSSSDPHTEEELDAIFDLTDTEGATGSRTDMEGVTGRQPVKDRVTDMEGATGSQTDMDRATGSQTDMDRATGSQTDMDRATGSQTDMDRATGSQTDMEGATGSQADMEATGSQTDMEGATGGQTDRDEATNSTSQTDQTTGVETATHFNQIREKALKGQGRVAKRMKQRGEKFLTRPCVGDNATLRIPEFDRGPCDPKNLLVVVMASDNNLFEVGCREGKLATKFTAADLDLVPEKLIFPQDVAADTISLRSAVAKCTGGQGYTKYNCTTKCQSLRCSCVKKKIKCNSKCHPGKACKN